MEIGERYISRGLTCPYCGGKTAEISEIAIHNLSYHKGGGKVEVAVLVGLANIHFVLPDKEYWSVAIVCHKCHAMVADSFSCRECGEKSIMARWLAIAN